MVEVVYVGEEYCNIVFVGGGNYFVIMDRIVRLDYVGYVCSGGGINIVVEWEECVRSY